MSACLFYIQCQSIPVWPYFSIRANGQNRTVIFNPQTGALTIVLHSLLSETVHLSRGGFTTPKWTKLTCYWFCNLTKPLSYVESYARHILFIMSLRSDSNQRLTHYKCVVLPTVLRRQVNTTRQISQWGSDRFLMFSYFTRPIEQPGLSKSLSRPCTFRRHAVLRFICRTL